MLKIDYTKQGDYMIPNIKFEEEKLPTGKYAQMRLKFLKTHKKAEYTILWKDKKLAQHLMEIQETATKRIELIVQQMKEKMNITEELKAQNQMEWVGQMNNIQATAEQTVIQELILV